MDTSDEWIRTRTGIRQRHISQGENTADLATQVGQRLLAKAHWAPTSLDLIIIATMSQIPIPHRPRQLFKDS